MQTAEKLRGAAANQEMIGRDWKQLQKSFMVDWAIDLMSYIIMSGSTSGMRAETLGDWRWGLRQSQHTLAAQLPRHQT